MSKKFINEMVEASLTGGVLDEKKVSQIAPHLSRMELKRYLKAIKRYIQKNTLVITSPTPLSASLKNDLKEKLQEENLEFTVDPELLFGVKITKDDMLYDNSLKSTFGEIVNYVKE